jgi:hypothetical protein
LGQRKRLGRREGFIEGGRRMGIEVVLHHPKELGLRIMPLDHRFHKLGIILFRALGTDLENALAGQGLKGQEEATGAVALIFMIFPLGFAGLQRQRHQHVLNQLTGPLIDTELGMLGIRGLFVQSQHILHMPQELTGQLPDTPALF